MSESLGTCIICERNIEKNEKKVTLTTKGVTGFNEASVRRGDSLSAYVGQNVHELCRKRYCSDKEIDQYNINSKRKSDEDQVRREPPIRRSQVSFDFRDHCLLCGVKIDLSNTRAEDDFFRVRSFDCQTKLLSACDERKDDWATTVKGRIQLVNDLHAADAIYHKVCNGNFRTKKNIPNRFNSHFDGDKSLGGRPPNIEREESFRAVISSFRSEDESCQTSIPDLVKRMSNVSDDPYTAKYMKQKLLEEFPDEVEISNKDGKEDVVTFKESVTRILRKFYESPKSDEQAEAQRIISTAATLLKCDIKKLHKQKDYYPDPDCLKSSDEMLEYLPRSLICFLELISSGTLKPLKLASIGQCLVQLARPKAVLAPLQLGLGVEMHHQYGSKHLIQTLNNMGFCCSYKEVNNFERCAASQAVYSTVQPTTANPSDSHCEYVADNVDHNPRTIDGRFSLHVMGLIRINTPAVRTRALIKRDLKSSMRYIEAAISIKYYEQPVSNNPLHYSNLPSLNFANPSELIDLSWKISRSLCPRGGWSGTMQAISRGGHPGKSSVTFLPMIDLEPSNLSCIYTTLCFVSKECEVQRCTPILTFDQPLYLKSKIIVNNESQTSELRNIVLSLGGFHTSMNFIGSICHFMESAGLREVLEVVYGENAVTHMLSGKAYERALRGLLLVDSDLYSLLLSDAYEISEESLQSPSASCSSQLNEVVLHPDLREALRLEKGLEDGISLEEDLRSNESLARIKSVIDSQKEKYSQFPTAKLWVQFMTMMDIERTFIRSERTSDWKLHLSSLQAMLPYFAAAGHNHYTKSVWLYLQDMSDLPNTHPDIYQEYISGHFVVRRSDRFWAGLARDLTIEQTLMRTMKSTGGLTRGRGVDQKQRLKWLMALPACAEVNSAMQELTGTYYASSDQHKDLTKTRMARDDTDLVEMLSFLRERSPFEDCTNLRNIASGVNADLTVNAHMATEIGSSILAKMEGQDALKLSFSRKDQVRTMAAKYSVCVDGDPVNVDPQLLFQRMVIIGMGKDDPGEIFEYELASRPSSMFDEYGRMRAAVKPQLADALSEIGSTGGVHEQPTGTSGVCYHVFDGGSLLYKVVWTKKQTFLSIAEAYAKYVMHYENPCVVFDGYGSSTTKQCTHDRRVHGVAGPKVDFRGDTALRDNREKFLSNVVNKQNLIIFLGQLLEQKGARVLHAAGDADMLIVNTAVECSKSGRTFLIGEDTDLLVLLCHQGHYEPGELYFRTDKRNAKHKIWDIGRLRLSLGDDLCQMLPFVHAICGCDTTSRLYGIGKGAVLKKAKDEHFKTWAKVFSKYNASTAEIDRSGEKVLCMLYGGRFGETLDRLRSRKFNEKVSTSSSSVEVHSLPPTTDAARFHSRRVYLQVQTWLGHVLKAEQWGWKLVNSRYEAILMDRAPAPESILKVIRCQCRGDCETRRCSCRKNGLQCTRACSYCNGSSCTNVSYPDVEDEESDLDE